MDGVDKDGDCACRGLCLLHCLIKTYKARAYVRMDFLKPGCGILRDSLEFPLLLALHNHPLVPGNRRFGEAPTSPVFGNSVNFQTNDTRT